MYTVYKAPCWKAEADRDCRPRQFQVNRDFGQDGGEQYEGVITCKPRIFLVTMAGIASGNTAHK